jgi:outer membrane protein assembly factor BamB
MNTVLFFPYPLMNPLSWLAGRFFGYENGLAYIRAEYRIKDSTHAVLYALDAQTGKELWSSGDEITSWSHWGGLSVANGRVYINTFDGMQYCFGVKSAGEQSAP